MKLNSHIHKTMVAALCVMALSPALMFASASTRPSKERGIVKSVDMEAHTLVVADSKNKSQRTFQWNEQTQFHDGKKSAAASDLKAGERVHLTYAPGGETPVLQNVLIAPAKTATHSSSQQLPAKPEA